MGLISRVSSRTYRISKMLPENLNSLKVTQLKDELRARNLKLYGKKAELIERLEQYLETSEHDKENIENQLNENSRNLQNLDISESNFKSTKKQDQNKEEKDYITFDIKEPLDYGMDEMAVRGVRLKIHKSEKMSVIINKYCEQEHLNKDHYKFQLNFHGQTLTDEDT